jgi:hypothetical protein
VVRLNKKRFALSLAIIGAIATPIWTKSLQSASEAFPISFEYENYIDDADRYLEAHGINKWACIIGTNKETERNICEESRHLVGNNTIVEKTTEYRGFRYELLAPFLRDIILSFLTPFIFVFVVPSIVRAYLRWVTDESK